MITPETKESEIETNYYSIDLRSSFGEYGANTSVLPFSDTNIVSSGLASTLIGGAFQSTNFVSGSSGWQLDANGNLEANDGTFRGALEANSLDIPDTTTANSFHVDSSGNVWWGATAIGSATAKVLNTGAATFTDATITGGSVGGTTTVGIANLNVANRGWTQTCAFSVTDADTVAWGAGSFVTADGGTTYSIGASNTGNMSAKTYIYLDTAVSTTAYQTTTTATTAVGAGKVLIATAQNGTGEATFNVLGGQGGQNIDASSIVANSISANELSTSITYAGAIIVDTNGAIRSGQTAFDTGTGWFIGSPSGTAKFSIGDASANKITWDGTSLNVQGVYQISKAFTAFSDISANDAVYYVSSQYSIAVAKASSQCLSHTDNAALSITGDFTIEAWINLTDLPDNEQYVIAGKHDDGTSKWSYSFSVTGVDPNRYLMIRVSDDGSAPGTDDKVSWSPSTATWYHVAVVYDASAGTADFFVNGSPQGSQITGLVNSLHDNDSVFGIGGIPTFSYYFNGKIDEVRLWNATRTEAQISANYEKVIDPGSTGLVGYWRLENNLVDETSNELTLTNNNAATFSTTIPTLDDDNLVAITRADVAGKTNGFIGFATSTVSAGATVGVSVAGIISDLTGITSGTFYYLSDTPGEISTSAGSNTRKVGVGLSTTQLLITNIW